MIANAGRPMVVGWQLRCRRITAGFFVVMAPCPKETLRTNIGSINRNFGTNYNLQTVRLYGNDGTGKRSHPESWFYLTEEHSSYERMGLRLN
jgi:hypothetical protein